MLLVGALALVTAAAPARAPPEPHAIEAVWRVQHFDFVHRSSRAFYACGTLQIRLATLLMTLGAHESVRVEMQCTGSRRVSSVRARIAVAVPMAATEENIRAATTFTARDMLAARLGGFTLPTAADVERFPAAWRRVAVSIAGRQRFDESECELLSDVQQQIFPLLSVRSAATLHCVPWTTRVIQTLDVEALVRVPE